MTAIPARRSFARLPRERRVGDILEAARKVFSEHGYESASMALIADRAGVVEGTIYKYFENKRDLLSQLLARWYEAMVADQDIQLAGITGLRNRLRFVVWRHLAMIAGEPALCRVFFTEVRSGVDYQASVLHALNRGYTRPAIEILREGVASGELRADLPIRLVRDLIYGTIEHHTFDYVCGRGELAPERLADELTDLILAGIRRPPEPAQADGDVASRLERVAARLEAVADRAAPA